MGSNYGDFDLIADCEERARVAHLADRMLEIEGAERVLDMIKIVGEQEGIAWQTVRRMYYAWREHGVAGLVDKRKVRPSATEHPGYKLFLVFRDKAVGGSDMDAFVAMMNAIRAGEVFEFGTWRDLWKADPRHRFDPIPERCPPRYVPYGWSYDNFNKKQRRDAGQQLQRIYARRGQQAALRWTPSVTRSRYDEERGAQVPALVVVEADDQWGNVMVQLPNRMGCVRPVSFSFVDVATGMIFDPYMKPRLVEFDGERLKSSNLNEFEFQTALAHFLCFTGLNKRTGTTFDIEKGTTAIRENVRQRIAMIPVYGRLIHFRTSGSLNTPAHKGLFVGSAGGNPRFKSRVEESHKDIQGRLSYMPGNLGRSAATKQESGEAMVRYAKNLMVDAAKYNLPPELARMMDSPLPTFDEYKAAFCNVVDQINDDIHHNLEGWVKYLKREFRSSEKSSEWWPWEEFERLDPVDRAMVTRRIQECPDKLTQDRRMSRREAFATWAADIGKLPLDEAWRFIDPRHARMLKVRPGNVIELTDSTYYPGRKMVYDAVCYNRANGKVALPVGKTVRVYWNPWGEMQNHVWYTEDVKDEKTGAVRENYIGMASRVKAGVVGRQDTILEAVGAALHKKALLMDGMEDRHFSDAVGKMAAELWNKAVLEAAKESAPERIAKSRRVRVEVDAESAPLQIEENPYEVMA